MHEDSIRIRLKGDRQERMMTMKCEGFKISCDNEATKSFVYDETKYKLCEECCKEFVRTETEEEERERIEIIGYFIHEDDNEINSYTAMAIIFHPYSGSLFCYTGQEAHCVIDDWGYLEECIPITKEQYIKANEQFYIPKEYLDKDNIPDVKWWEE